MTFKGEYHLTKSFILHLSFSNDQMQKIQNYINGELIAPTSGEYLDNYNPAEGKVYSLIPDSNVDDIQLAVDAAKIAFPFGQKHQHRTQ